MMLLILIGIISIIILIAFFFFLYIVNKSLDEDNEFEGVGTPITSNDKFDKFKERVKQLSEKDNEIKEYLKHCKDKHAGSSSNICNSGDNRADNGEDISPDI